MLKFAILGILKEKPSTGYEIRKIIDSKLMGIWSASHAQIYPELNALFTAGLITYEIDVKGKHLERKRYDITEQGEKEFLNWLESDAQAQTQIRDEMRLKVFFGGCMDGEKAKSQLASQLTQHKRMLEELCDQTGRVEPGEPINPYNDLALKGKILQEKSYIEWLHLCIEAMEQFN